MEIYVVKAGDNVDRIAAETGVPVERLIYDNQIEYPYRLAVGQALLVRDGAAPSGRTPLYVSGYAYPFINREVLAETLPWLSAVKVFSYGFNTEGSLIPPQSPDAWMVAAAREAGVIPVLTLTPIDASGHFNNNLVSALVRNEALQERIIWELGRTVQEQGFGGVDIDFEYVLAEDRVAFAGFVERTTRVMNTFGYPVSVALAPKTSRDQPGLLYEGIDYRLLGEAANRVMLMTYEWGYSQGPPMAVAPINMVRRVVDYAVSEIPPEKISLGIPNYAYIWPLPYVRGTTRATTVSNLQAVETAVRYGVEIQFDETAQTPWFRFWQYGIRHEVWFEDVRSLRAKFALVKEYGLSGVGYWQLMNYFRANWLLLNEMFVRE